MCVFLSMRADKANLQKRFGSVDVEDEYFGPVYVQNAFEFPKWPVITAEDHQKIRLLNWGLIPGWVKSLPDAQNLRSSTVNARAETIFEKPAFRSAAATRHCLVLADGFFEFREVNGKKFPYFIRIQDGLPFAMAGLYEYWTNRDTGEVVPTFSIITTVANSLMETIHNRKKRMPVILPLENEMDWLMPGSSRSYLLKPYPAEQMEAWPVAALLTSRKENRNVPRVQEPFDYAELSGSGSVQGTIFGF